MFDRAYHPELDASAAIEVPRPAPGKVSLTDRRYPALVQRRAAAAPQAAPAAYPPASVAATADAAFSLHLPHAPVQRAASHEDAHTAGAVGAAAAHGISGAGGALPHGDVIQRAFGRHDLGGLVAHTDAAAAAGARAMGARAFATGHHVAFDGAPDLHTAAHEAAHVIQQRAGVALKGGVGADGDVYEQHADAVADAVVAGRSAEALLDGFAGGGGGGGGGVQRKTDGAAPGGATVAGSAADTERAVDDSFTPALVRALRSNPNLSIEAALKVVTGKAQTAHEHVQHGTAVEYGKTNGDGSGAKRAVLIPNQNYKTEKSLETPIAEASEFKGALDGRGFDVSVHADQTAPQMATLWNGLVAKAEQGDELVAYYGGHGLPQGLAGVTIGPDTPDDIFSNAQVAGVVDGATSKGANIRFVMDSCHSGSAVETVREERSNQLKKRDPKAPDVAAMKRIEGLKQDLVKAVLERQQACARFDADIAAAEQAKKPAEVTRVTKLKEQSQSLTRDIIDMTWASIVKALGKSERLPPPPITEYETLGEQVAYLDRLWNAHAQPGTDAK